MKIAKKSVNADAEKAKTFRELVSKVEAHGLKVRREKLTRGFGYNVSPGMCRLDQQKLVFVNSHARIEEQIVFMQELLVTLTSDTRQAA